ncbi:VUT family protein [Streptomyces sp. NPDC090499]|uniref:VUT family protein n=1 Tax=Streptomyces sp. NPDC090499 TaxID=3365965 RepID=UPI00382B8A3C
MTTASRRRPGLAAVAAYAAAITGANYLTSRYGLVHVGPGLVTTAGTYAAGAALLLRDVVQDLLGRTWVLAGIATGALLTWATSPALAIASATAFLIAELADMAIYTPLRTRGWAKAVLASNTVGAIVDTLLFLGLAGFPITTAAVGGQLVGKLAWATLLPVAAVLTVRQARRAVSRNTVRA